MGWEAIGIHPHRDAGEDAASSVASVAVARHAGNVAHVTTATMRSSRVNMIHRGKLPAKVVCRPTPTAGERQGRAGGHRASSTALAIEGVTDGDSDRGRSGATRTAATVELCGP